MALNGIKVIELAGLAPVPLCGAILKDFGAIITRIDKIPHNSLDCLQEGKRSLALDLKSEKGQSILRSLCKTSDVLIDAYRPGVMEKLNLGPDILLQDNPKLIYARLTGFGQTGPLANRAGHDINYTGLSGVLSFLRTSKSTKPIPPINLIADFAGGSLLCAFAICTALLERHRSGLGQVIDHSMSEGAAYVASWLMRSQQLPIWGEKCGNNILDGGAFYYNTYETKDGKYMSVGALEHSFYETFLKHLNLDVDLPQFGTDNEHGKQILTDVFLTKTQKEWSDIFEDTDACCYPVLDFKDAPHHRHNVARNAFVDDNLKTTECVVPCPAPKLSRTPAVSGAQNAGTTSDQMDVAVEILKEINMTQDDVKQLFKDGVLLFGNAKL